MTRPSRPGTEPSPADAEPHHDAAHLLDTVSGPDVESAVAATLVQESARPPLRGVPLAHLSVEIGHLYTDQLQSADADHLTALFARAVRQLPVDLYDLLVVDSDDEEPRRAPGRGLGREATHAPRISTCVLIDDYSFGDPATEPSQTVPRVIAAARRAGIRLDYLAREAACAQVDDVSPAALLVRALVPEPPEGASGARPPASLSGWVCNGVRSPDPIGPAMSPSRWQPPRQNAPEKHSIFVDVELWSPYDGSATEPPPVPVRLDVPDRRWSCAALAATWQLLRLGLLRHHGEPVWTAHPLPQRWPKRWSQLPPLIRLRTRAAPFAAYRTVSLLPNRFLLTESGVRTILGQVAADLDLLAEAPERAHAEGTPIPARIDSRVGYVLYSDD